MAILLYVTNVNVIQGLGGDKYSSSSAQRDKLLTATERLNKTSDRLQTGRQQLAQTEVRLVLCTRIGSFVDSGKVPRSAVNFS